MIELFAIIVTFLGFVAYVVFELVKLKRVNKSSVNIEVYLTNPTPDNIDKAMKEAKYITAKTDSTISLPASLNVARVKALKESRSNPDKTTKE